MRFLWVYLIIYFALVLGAFVALWIGGVLSFVPTLPVLLGLIVACGLGVLLAFVWRWRPSNA